MSLINDALKRAKHVQQNATPPVETGPQLRPAERPENDAQAKGLLGPITLGSVAVTILLLAALWVQNGSKLPSNDGSVVVRARTSSGVPPAPAQQAGPAAEQVPTPATLLPQPALIPAHPDSQNPTPSITEKQLDTSAVSAADTAPAAALDTNTTPVIQPPPLRLQAILFSPKRPSAMIGGETLFVGDKFRDLRVAAITRTSLVLVGAGQTNVLTLEK